MIAFRTSSVIRMTSKMPSGNLPTVMIELYRTVAAGTIYYNVLTFEISGHIQMQPYPMEFTVQSNVDLETNRIELHHTRSPAP